MAARLDFGIQYQADVGDPVGVDGMAGSARLLRVVAQNGTGLMTVEDFDRGVAIQSIQAATRASSMLSGRACLSTARCGPTGLPGGRVLQRN